MKLLVTNRRRDYHVEVEGNPEIWGTGNNPREAIGNMIQAHKDKFGVTEIRSTNY